MEETPVDFKYYNSLPNICSYCQEPFSDKNKKTFDHIIPRNGKKVYKCKPFSEIDNLLICCERCNQLKGRMSLEKFIYKIRFGTIIPKMSNKKRELIINQIKLLIEWQKSIKH